MINLVPDGRKSILECPVAEVDDIATRYPVILAVVEVVRIFTGWESSMAGGKKEDPIAPTALTKIETTSSFKVRDGLGSDLETKCWSEWATYVSCWINGEDMVEELLSSGPGEGGLPERDFNVSDLILQEDLLAAHSCVLGIIRGECPR